MKLFTGTPFGRASMLHSASMYGVVYYHPNLATSWPVYGQKRQGTQVRSRKDQGVREEKERWWWREKQRAAQNRRENTANRAMFK
nr:hypothetical protein Itr_chr01CG00990 [Ipomoea trifida]